MIAKNKASTSGLIKKTALKTQFVPFFAKKNLNLEKFILKSSRKNSKTFWQPSSVFKEEVNPTTPIIVKLTKI